MRIEWTEFPNSGQVGLRAIAEDYDAIRFPRALLLDSGPRLRSAERLAVAGTLLFGKRAEGGLTLPGAISPTAALEIERFVAPSWVRIREIDLAARRLPPGNTSLVVVWDDDVVPDRVEHISSSRRMVLRLARADKVSGTSVGVDEMVVTSNAWLFAEPTDATARHGPLLALGVLFAEDLEAESVSIVVGAQESEEMHTRFGPLLATAGLNLEPVLS